MNLNHSTFHFVNARHVIFFLICLNFLSCRASSDKADIDAIAIAELGKDFNLELNENKTYALCQQKRIADHPDRILKYIVVNVSTKMIVYNGNFKSGYVKWFNNDSIEVTTSDKASVNLTKTVIGIKSNEQ